MENASYIETAVCFFHQLLEKDVKKATKTWEKLMEEKAQELPNAFYVKQRFQLPEFAYFTLLHALVYAVDAEVAKACAAIMPANQLYAGVTMTLYSRFSSLSYTEELQLEGEAMKLLLEESEEPCFLMRDITLRKDVLQYLITGDLPHHPEFYLYDRTENAYAPIQLAPYTQLLYMLSQRELVLLSGLSGSGRHTLLKRYSQQENRMVLFLKVSMWRALSPSRKVDRFAGLLVIALLSNALICLEHYETQEVAYLEVLLQYLAYYDLDVVLLGDRMDHIEVAIVQLPRYLNNGDEAILREALGLPQIEATCYRYSPMDLQNLAQQKQVGYEMSLPPLAQSLTPYCHILTPFYTLQDWLGTADLKEQLAHLIYILKHRRELDAQVSFQSSYTILFHGPSGTGKTMAAAILGNETNLPVWQINLSGILDKYIGESEKHLEEVFTQAQKQNGILLFDEADVLFSRRTNITSSNDRYANSSTAYLLQKLESYDGVVILTSNLLQNFDDAFLRRLRYMLRFPMPSKEVREQKWRACFSQLPLETELPYARLAQLTSLSLAQIDNVCENAQYYRMEEGCHQLGLRHLQNALQLEFQKKQESVPMDLLERKETSCTNLQ